MPAAAASLARAALAPILDLGFRREEERYARDPAACWPLRRARWLAAAIELRVEAVDQPLAATMRPACRLSVRSVTAHGPTGLRGLL